MRPSKKQLSSAILIAELVVLVGPVIGVTLFALLIVLPQVAAAVEVDGHADSFLVSLTLAIGAGLLGIAGLLCGSAKAVGKGIAFVPRATWLVISAVSMLTAAGLAIGQAEMLGWKSPEWADSLVLMGIFGAPALLPAVHLGIWRALAVRPNNSSTPKPLRGSA